MVEQERGVVVTEHQALPSQTLQPPAICLDVAVQAMNNMLRTTRGVGPRRSGWRARHSWERDSEHGRILTFQYLARKKGVCASGYTVISGFMPLGGLVSPPRVDSNNGVQS